MPLAAAVLGALLAVTPSATTPADASPRRGDVAAVVRRCVDAYGGKSAIARAARTRQEGTVTSIMHAGDAGRIIRTYERPGRLRVETAYPDGNGEVRIIDGSRGWRDGESVEGPRLASMLLQAARLDLPALLASWEAKIVDRGTAEHAGKTLRLLSIQPAPGIVVEAGIDPESGRILRSRGASLDPQMPLEFMTSYSDFRKVDGVLVPFHEENWANGRTTGETVLRKVEFPKTLPEQVFRP